MSGPPPTPPPSRPSSSTASAISAFAVGIALTYLVFHTISFDDIFAAVAGAYRRMRYTPVRRQLSGARSHRDPAVHRRHGQIRADLPAHLAGGCDGRPDAGLRAHPCRHHGRGRRVHDRAHVAAASTRRPVAHGSSSRSSAPPPRCSPAPSAACRTTSSASSPIPPARSSATCSWPPASAPIRWRCSISSTTPSSRRCCSWRPARSSTRCRTSRISA